MSRFKKASKQKQKLKLAVYGPSGSGKTWSALLLANAMGCKNIAVIDSEKSAALYSDRFKFDVCSIEDIGKDFINEVKMTFKEALASDYDCVIIDSFTHVWKACLDYLNKLSAAKSGLGKGNYFEWAKVTPLLDELVHLILNADKHVIVTMRAKTAHEAVKTTRDGKETLEIATKGIEAVMRDGIEYEFTTILRLNMDHTFNTVKDRTGLFDNAIEIPEPLTEEVGKKLIAWLNAGDEPTKPILIEPTPVKEAKIPSNNVKERADALYQAFDVVEDTNSYNAVVEEFEAIREMLPAHVLEQFTVKMIALDARYKGNIEVPF